MAPGRTVPQWTPLEPCGLCGALEAVLTKVGHSWRANCVCGVYIKWVSNAELGVDPDSKRTRPGIPPSQRRRIFERDGYRCIMDGRGPDDGARLEIGHLISVADGERIGATHDEIWNDNNLATFCDVCNSGQGDASLPLPLVYRLYRNLQARITRSGDE